MLLAAAAAARAAGARLERRSRGSASGLLGRSRLTRRGQQRQQQLSTRRTTAAAGAWEAEAEAAVAAALGEEEEEELVEQPQYEEDEDDEDEDEEDVWDAESRLFRRRLRCRHGGDSSSSSPFLPLLRPATGAGSGLLSSSRSSSSEERQQQEGREREDESCPLALSKAYADVSRAELKRAVAQAGFRLSGKGKGSSANDPSAPHKCPALVLDYDRKPFTLFPLCISPWHEVLANAFKGRVRVLASYPGDRWAPGLPLFGLDAMPSVVARNSPTAADTSSSSSCSSSSSSSRRRSKKHYWGSVTREGEEPLPPASRVPPPFRRNVFLRDAYRCQYCGRRFPFRLLSLDHVFPKSLGGQDTWENLASACTLCNSRKGARLVHELPALGMRLLRAPHAPTAIELAYTYIDMLPRSIFAQWSPFLEEPLRREANQLRAYHATFSLPAATAAAAANMAAATATATATLGGGRNRGSRAGAQPSSSATAASIL